MKPTSNPTHYADLVRELDEAQREVGGSERRTAGRDSCGFHEGRRRYQAIAYACRSSVPKKHCTVRSLAFKGELRSWMNHFDIVIYMYICIKTQPLNSSNAMLANQSIPKTRWSYTGACTFWSVLFRPLFLPFSFAFHRFHSRSLHRGILSFHPIPAPSQIYLFCGSILSIRSIDFSYMVNTIPPLIINLAKRGNAPLHSVSTPSVFTTVAAQARLFR